MSDGETSCAGEARPEDDNLPKCPKRVVIGPSDRSIHNDRRYVEFLRDHGIKIDPITEGSLRLSEFIGTRKIGAGIVLVLVGSFVLGIVLGCNSWFSAGCRTQTFLETKTILSDAAIKREAWPKPKDDAAAVALPITTAGALQPESEPMAITKPQSATIKTGSAERSVVDRQQQLGAPFHLSAFQASIIVCGFVLAFSRWMIENRQSSMSELFERKKEVNLLLLKDEKGVFEPLISDAVSADPTPGELHPKVLGEANCLRLRNASMREPGKAIAKRRTAFASLRKAIGYSEPAVLPDNSEFLRQMFVYIELDNFELALNRYTAGLLDPEQMYRAWEIIHSRCLNRKFRGMAAVQGLKYYTDEFHQALQPVLIRTEHFDENSKPR